MSTEKVGPSVRVNDERELKFDYSCPAGRLSPSSWDDSNEELSDTDSCSIVDRQQSPAMVRRRTGGVRYPVLDKDSSDEFVGCSGTAVASPYLSTVRQSGIDSDSDEMISGIENHVNEKHLSLIRSKAAGNQSNMDECVSVFNRKVANQTEIFGGVDFRSNPDCELSKMVEVEEEKYDGSLGNRENPRSAVPLCFQTNNKFADLAADALTNFSKYHTLGANDVDNRWIAAVKYSPRNGVRVVDENNWPGMKSEGERENFRYTLTCEESEYVSSSLKFIFDEKAHAHEESTLSDVGARLRNEMRADDEKENVSMTLNLPDNVSSEETVDFGLENLFRTGVRSGREAFLMQESCGAWDNPTITRRVSGGRTTQPSKPDIVKDYLSEADHVTYFDEDRKRNRQDIFLRDDNLRKRDDSSSGSKTERLNLAKNLRNEHSNGSRQSSPDSFRRKILLDLSLSDNDDKCSTIDGTIFGDSPEYVNKFRSGSNLGNGARSPSKYTTVANSMAVAGKPRGGTADESYKGNTHIHRYDYRRCGNGDSKWNSDEKIRRPKFPQDRGDMTYERPETEPSWGKLITNLERTYPNRKLKETVFWVDMGRNYKNPEIFRTGALNVNPSIAHTKMTRCRTKPRKRKRESVVQPPSLESDNQWGRLFDRRGNWLVNTVIRHEDFLTRSKRRFQTLIVTRKRSRRPRRYKWHSSIETTNDDSKSIDCFCNLFRQIVNVFTDSRKCSK